MTIQAETFFLATLGCKVNQYESHALREAWLRSGLTESADPASADLILVNSCAVTAKAVADVRATVRRMHRAAPLARILVTGCAAQVMASELASLPGVEAVMDQEEKARLFSGPPTLVLPQSPAPDFLDATPAAGLNCHAALHDPQSNTGSRAGRSWRVWAEPTYGSDGFDTIPTTRAYPAFAVSGYDRSRAVLKIQDGCSHGCTYCIVPQARGRACSREPGEVLEEARRLLDAGFREIVVSGVNLRQYWYSAKDCKGDFWNLLAYLDAELSPEWGSKARLRLSSLEPGQLGAKALEVIADCGMVAPHIHLSLQSGSPSVLRRMGRGHYDPARLPDFFAALGGIWPVFGLGADILTGFPGETEDEFREGFSLCETLPLTYAHVFPYSKRPGTRAAAMQDQVAADVKKARAAGLRGMVMAKKSHFLQSLLTLPVMRVAFEDREHGKNSASLRGVNEYYADCRINVQTGTRLALRELVPVRVLGVENGELTVDTR